MQVAQKKAARLVLGCSYKTSTDYMHTQLVWLTVEQKISLHLLMLLRSIISTKYPSGLAHQIHVTSVHGYSSRSAAFGHILLPVPKTYSRKLTVIYRSIVLWNCLPKEIISTANNKIIFKNLTKKYLAN